MPQTPRDVSSHGMIGVSRMIILLAGQIILSTRMIGRDDQTKGKRRFPRSLLSLKRLVSCHPGLILVRGAANYPNFTSKRKMCHPTIILQYSTIVAPPSESWLLNEEDCKMSRCKIGVLDRRCHPTIILAFLASLPPAVSNNPSSWYHPSLNPL